MASREYLALRALEKPVPMQVGNMYLNRRLGIVKVYSGHTKGTRYGSRPTTFHLYHWGKPSIQGIWRDLRDNHPDTHTFDPNNDHGEIWEYVGNLFDYVPLHSLCSVPRTGSGI